MDSSDDLIRHKLTVCIYIVWQSQNEKIEINEVK